MKLSYKVGIARKRQTNPWFGQGSSLAYTVDGEQGKALALTRGFRYTFSVEADGYPFYLSTSELGAGEGDVTGGRATERGVLSFLVTKEMPETLYYQCTTQVYMGGSVSVVPHTSIHLAPFLSGLYAPIALTQAPGDDTVYVADQVGVVYGIQSTRSDVVQARMVLDIRDRLPRLDPSYEERGLLDVAFPPDHRDRKSAEYRRVYVTYSGRVGGLEGSRVGGLGGSRVGGQGVGVGASPRGEPYETRLSRFSVGEGGVVDPSTEEVLLRVGPLTWPHHLGGRLAFDRLGLLYMSVGDGGPQRDPEGKAQDLSALHGKVLRLDTDVRSGYVIPRDNPFRGEGQRAEIYAYGFRNVWGLSFDDQGRLFASDVGLDTVEEVDIVKRGGNYGWNALEGTVETGFGTGLVGSRPIPPVWEYTHEEMRGLMRDKRSGIAIIGGYYLPGYGYVLADYSGVLMRVDLDEPGNRWVLLESVSTEYKVHALGVASGRLYVLTTTSGGLKRGTGTVFQLQL
jgi:glucose/arabinose dehydrogenase